MNDKSETDGRIEQVSPRDDCGESGSHSLLEEASLVARRVLESIQAIAGTTAAKGVQIANLERFAREKGCWIEDINELGTFSDRGSENEVYLSNIDNTVVYKLNDFRYSDDNLTSFFERMEAHNFYFPDCAYELIGFTKNQSGKICAVLSQSLVVAIREATQEEIDATLIHLGFRSELNGEYYSNGKHDIFDALPNNVLIGNNGRTFFIDTIIYRTQDNGLESYRNLSPRYAERKKRASDDEKPSTT
ncbi:MAG: hypothetical protein LBN29_10890 [Mediterranea sp.]|jgi:hypothetical protein|nr:hypothetical protein [Mediterranea sp.]